MQREGPPLEILVRRLSETPEYLLAEPKIGSTGALDVRAVVSDVLRLCGHPPNPASLQVFAGADARRDRNRLAVALIACWLLTDDWFQRAGLSVAALLKVLSEDAA